MRTRQKIVASLATLALALSLSGCLDADKISTVSYDAKADAFTVLRLYINIHGDQPEDAKNLLAMYANRDHILPVELWSILGEKGIMRMSDGVREVDLGKATMDVGEIKPPFDISTLENKPGKFFANTDGNICYYHQITIPGAAMDKMVAWAQDEAQKQIAKLAADEIDSRKLGGKRVSWDHQRKILQGGIRGLPEADRERQGEGETMLISAMDDASLQLLADAAKKNAFTLSRKAGVFRAAAKISPDDAREIKATLAMVRAELQNQIEGGAGMTREDIGAAMIVDALDVTTAADGRVEAGADIAKLAPLVSKLQVAAIKAPDATKADDYKRIADGVSGAKPPMDDEMTPAQALEKFNKGGLKSNPSEKPVTAGEGLGDAK